MKLLVISRDCFAGDTEAAVAARALAAQAGRAGMTVEVLTGPRLGDDSGVDLADWLGARGYPVEVSAAGLPPHLRTRVDGLPVTLQRAPTAWSDEPDDRAREAFARLFDAALDRIGPDVVVAQGGDRTTGEALGRARGRGIAAAVALHDLRDREGLDSVDPALVASRFAADFLADARGRHALVAPTLVDPGRAVVEGDREPRHVTFVDPSAANGAYLFARIVDELGRVRPDIPVRIIGARGSGSTVARSGIDVFARGTVRPVERTANPRDHWRTTRLAVVPSLAWDASPRIAAEARANGIPIVASDRGPLPEIVGESGVCLPVPDRITAATATLPTAAEVAPWVAAIVRLWDDPGEHRQREAVDDASALSDALRSIRPGSTPRLASDPGRARWVVLVPHHDGIEPACERSLRVLEDAGVRVVRSEGCAQIDVARNMLASDALRDGAESILFIDSDLGFDPLDALRLLARPEPVVSGVYAKKRARALASVFADGTAEVTFGRKSPGDYPLKYAAGGFLRVKAAALRRMIDELNLPACNTAWDRRDYPFFLPLVVAGAEGVHHYLGEDWAFSHRLGQVGITPLADTTIRLWHYGAYPYGWEDAGAETPRHRSFVIRFEGG